MRYLWVEDFGDDSEDQWDKQEAWQEYFDIEDNILLYSLEDALKYLDNYENRSSFDAVLLDIRFPVLSEDSVMTESDIYETYFADIITKNMFEKYSNSDVMKDASSGILQFMALVYRYGYSWNNIAFISANIDDEDLSAVNTLKELMTKVKYEEQLSSREKTLYKTRYLDLFSEEGIVEKKLEIIDEKLKIVTCDELISDLTPEKINSEIKKLNTIQEKINSGVPEQKRKGLKYCSVRNQFEMIGLKMPPAFEKPTDESQKKCWLFTEWKDSRLDDVTIAKRIIINMCCILQNNIHGNVSSFLAKQRIYNDEDSTITEETIKQFLQNIIRNVTDFPGLKTQENKLIYAGNIVDTVSSIWESIEKPKVNNGISGSYYEFAYYAVMRLTRNWMAHQGIKGIDIQFASFAFLLSMKGIFDVSKFSVEDQNAFRKEEEKLVNFFGYNTVAYQTLDIEEIMHKEYRNTYQSVENAIPQNYSGQMRLPEKEDPFALISALGHSDSCVRERVSVTELYKAFWLCVYFGDKNSRSLKPEDNKNRDIIKILENIYSYQA